MFLGKRPGRMPLYWNRKERDMPLVTSESLLLDAQRNGYAVGAFNVENMEMAQAVISAAKEEHSPVIIQTTPSTTKYGTLDRKSVV